MLSAEPDDGQLEEQTFHKGPWALSRGYEANNHLKAAGKQCVYAAQQDCALVTDL